jgi:hypothetical protein
MKTLIGIFICLIIVSGCSGDSSGRYFSTVHKGNYIDLNKDGTFMLFEDMKGANGKYEINDDEITLKFNFGTEEKCIYKDGKIIDRQNEIYIKKKPIE